MKRRKFIKSAAAASVVVPSMINGIPLQAHSNNAWLQSVLNPGLETDHVMVLIYLGGGNDGLNTVVPVDNYSKLDAARKNVLLPQNQLLKLNGFANTALHPAMTGMQTLFNEGKVNIVQSVGYPNPNFSHFRATDIWASASEANQYLDSGWLGRYLNEEFPGFPLDYPNVANPDPLAIQVGANLPLLFQGPNAQMSMNVSNPDIFGAWPTGLSDPAPATPLGHELNYIRTISRQSKTYADTLVKGFLKGNNLGNYPAGNYLADTLKVIARLINGGLKTRLYLVNLYGFDTHSDQVVAGNNATGAHANLLKLLSDAVFSFQRDIELMNVAHRVMGMTFSEFGRRIKSNDSVGTDHGAAAPLFVFGSKARGGITGNNPIIPATVTENDNLPMQYDFRSVYASVLKDWFCVKDDSLQRILLKNFQALPLIKNECSTTDTKNLKDAEDALQIIASPNPMTSFTNIQIATGTDGIAQLQLIDPLGRLTKVLFSGKLQNGTHQFRLENEGYAPGNYYIRLQQGNAQKTEPLLIVR
ncbi:MAG: DUF1501 domain-containing protein [Saprospiraceae bacterium]